MKKNARPKIDQNAIKAVYGNAENSENRGTALLENLGKMITGSKISIIKHQMNGFLSSKDTTPTITQSNQSTADVTDRSSTCNYNRLRNGLVNKFNNGNSKENAVFDSKTVKSNKNDNKQLGCNSQLNSFSKSNEKLNLYDCASIPQTRQVSFKNSNNNIQVCELPSFKCFSNANNRKLSSPNYEDAYDRFNASPNIESSKQYSTLNLNPLNEAISSDVKNEQYYRNDNDGLNKQIKAQLSCKVSELDLFHEDSKQFKYDDFHIDQSFLDKLSYEDLLQSEEVLGIPNIQCLDFLKVKRLPTSSNNLELIRKDSPHSYSDFWNDGNNRN